MTQLSGYAGKQLRVALDTGEITTEDVDAGIIAKYLGGVGYAAKLLHDELDGDVDPLGPANKLIFATGPLSRYEVPGGGSIEVCFKSANGTWGEARCGGNIGPDLKRAGFDFVIIEGQSAKPVYLVIRDGKAELKPAERLVGLPVSEKIKLVGEELPEEDSVAGKENVDAITCDFLLLEDVPLCRRLRDKIPVSAQRSRGSPASVSVPATACRFTRERKCLEFCFNALPDH